MRDCSSNVVWAPPSHSLQEALASPEPWIVWARASFAILYVCSTFSRHASLVLLSTGLAVVLEFPAALSTPLPTHSWDLYYQVMMCQAIARWGKSLKENDVAVEASMVILFSFMTCFSTPKAFKLLLFLLRCVGGFERTAAGLMFVMFVLQCFSCPKVNYVLKSPDLGKNALK